MKTAAKLLAGLLLTASAAWSGTLLYWHLRLRKAVETFATAETRYNAQERQDAVALLVQAGCRSLPYLVDEMDESKTPQFLHAATFLIQWESAFPGFPLAEINTYAFVEERKAWIVLEDDPSAVRRQKCDRIRAWWRESGANRHQWWRIWSSKCSS